MRGALARACAGRLRPGFARVPWPAREQMVVLAVLAVGVSTLFLAWPRALGYLLMEDLPLEWLEFFCAAVAGWWWARAATRRTGLGRLACGATALFCLFLAGEEISWGQRVFGYKTPEVIASRNVQREPTLHNMARQLVQPRSVATAVVILSTAMGVMGSTRRGRGWLTRQGLPCPPFPALVAFWVAVWLMSFPLSATDDEVGELFFSLGLLFAAPPSGVGGVAGRTVGRLAILSVLCSGLCFLRPAHRQQVANVGHLKVAQLLEARGRRWEAAGEYEALARYWGTHWDLWVQTMELYFREGDWAKAEDLALEFLAVHRREWKPFEILARVGLATGRTDHVRTQLSAILRDEPYNDFAWWALLLLDARSPWPSQGDPGCLLTDEAEGGRAHGGPHPADVGP